MRLWAPILAVLVVAPFLVIGITWGLPSRDSDRYLFASHPVWSGEEILRLAGGWSQDEQRGADVARNRLAPGTQPIPLNDTDEERARIILRYRLYTHQPDEMINLRAYSQMRPGRLELDPKMYQYGGVWFYANAVALKLASACGLVTLSSNAAYYIDHPEQSGRIYVVLRCMTAAYALAGVGAMYLLARLAGGAKTLSCLIAIAFGTAPGIVVFAHEAKPHVAGLTLTLFALVAGVAYVKGGGRRRLWASGVLAGLAFGAVLTALPAALIPITAAIIRRERRTARAATALVLFAATYAVTNPYVVHHLLVDRELLVGQLSNTTAMYRVSSPAGSLGDSLKMLVGVAPVCVLVGCVVAALRGKWGTGRMPVLLMTPTFAFLLGAFFLLSHGKPGEYARFGLMIVPFSLLLMAQLRPVPATACLGIALLVQLPAGGIEVFRFLRDSGPESSRIAEADLLARLRPVALRIRGEPAPYNMPPVDLWGTRVLLSQGNALPRLNQPPQADDWLRMSWADRYFEYIPVDKAAP